MLVIGYRYVFHGADTIGEIRGAPEHLAGTVAMPFMIGPGTISAAVVTGINHGMLATVMVVALTIGITCIILILMKYFHDILRYCHAKYIDHYFDIVG